MPSSCSSCSFKCNPFHSCLSHTPTPTCLPRVLQCIFSTIYFYSVIASLVFLTHIRTYVIHSWVYIFCGGAHIVINMKLLFYIPLPSSGFSKSLTFVVFICRHRKNISSQLTSVLLSCLWYRFTMRRKNTCCYRLCYSCDKMLWWCAMTIMLKFMLSLVRIFAYSFATKYFF